MKPLTHQTRAVLRLSLLAAILLAGAATSAASHFRLQAGSEADLVFKGAAAKGLTGLSLAALGDVNRDGYPDLAVTMPGANKVYVILGRTFTRGIVDLLSSATLTGVVVVQANPLLGDRFGWSVSTAGDFNGDGVNDLVIGWPGCNLRAPLAGGAAVIFGDPAWSNAAVPIVLNAGALPPGAGTLILGGFDNDQAGACVAGGGDFDGDGFDDLAIAVPAEKGPSRRKGRFYTVFGAASSPPALDLEPIGPRGFRINLHPYAGLFPETSSTVCTWPGDVNQDGKDDLLLGTPLYNNQGTVQSGAAWVLFGRTGYSSRTLSLDDFGTTVAGVKILPDKNIALRAHFGFAVAGTGDLNRDGVPDFAVSAPDGRWLGRGGLVGVFFGRAGLPAVIDLRGFFSGFWIADDFGDPNDRFGASLAAAGDPNNDRVRDLIVGAPSAPDPTTKRATAGHAYVIYLDAASTGSVILRPPALTAAPAVGVTRLDQAGQTTDRPFVDLVGVFGSPATGKFGDQFGWSVCGPGDLNGDGVDDVLVGSPAMRPQFAQSAELGFAYAFFFDPPQIRSVYLDDPNGNRQPDPGETFHVVMDKRVVVKPGPAQGRFFLTGIAQLGADSSVTQTAAGSNRFQIVLGRQSSGIVVPGPGTELDFDANGPRNWTLSRRLGINPMDHGLPQVNDRGVDLQLAMTPISRTLPPTGGVVAAPSGADVRYGGHAIEFPPGSLSGSAVVELTPVPDPPGDFGLGSAVWVAVSQSFTRARLTINYSDDDVPPGFDERQMRIVYLHQTGPGQWDLRVVPGDQVVDTVNNTISVWVDSIPPGGAPAPGLNGLGGSGGFAGLPIETVDERKQGMTPNAGAGASAVKLGLAKQPGKTATVTLTPGPYSVYTQHKLVFHDYATSTPGDVIVTIRTAALAERTGNNPVPGNQYFPDRSEALFTLETTDGAGLPLAFTTPVDLEVEYEPESNPHGVSDVMDFDGNPCVWQKLQIVRSVQDPGNNLPNFVFLAGPQQVIYGQSVVQLTGFTNLTDARGCATYGVVGNPTVTSAARWRQYR